MVRGQATSTQIAGHSTKLRFAVCSRACAHPTHPRPKVFTRTAWLATVLMLFAGCAQVKPVPCEDLETATATGGRTYPRLCP